jgi:hypothetical protein
MPKRPRGARKKSSSNLTEDQAHFLSHGFCFDGFHPDFHHPRIGGELPRDCPFETVEDMRVAWTEDKDIIMAQSKPGERPWAFFRFAKEPRLRIPMLFGFGPQGWIYYPVGTEGLFDARPTEVEETEYNYLTRLDLWQPGELEAWQQKR